MNYFHHRTLENFRKLARMPRVPDMLGESGQALWPAVRSFASSLPHSLAQA
jgi:hypothetical protein